MSGSIKKIQSSSAMPLNKRSNILRYDLGEEAGQVDMKASYLELQLTIDGVGDYVNIVTGRDGLLYNPACLFRRCSACQRLPGRPHAQSAFRPRRHCGCRSGGCSWG